ncbi:MAG TPA: hypothetical protein VMS38_14930 [Pseudorhodoferax sp.]|nr:hypothetical protein [Pseudorhodoferax sp.]
MAATVAAAELATITRASASTARIGHRGQQGVEVQAPACAGQDVDVGDRTHAGQARQPGAQLRQVLHRGCRRINEDVQRADRDRDRDDVQAVPGIHQEDSLEDADAANELDVESHGRSCCARLARPASRLSPSACMQCTTIGCRARATRVA